ncbi:MAG: transposase [Candidatus Magasanikbacteria bacterium]|nr:transposase [Candidatus Magasanikbacteria bacterium]
MKRLYKGKYRVDTFRLRGWDYSSNGYYFITICVKDRKEVFGGVVNGVMVLNKVGLIAHNFWLEIPNHFCHVFLDEFVIMPDHVHGIILIDGGHDSGVAMQRRHNNHNSAMQRRHNNEIPLQHYNQTQKNQYMSKISPKPGSIPTIIRSYKSICTRTINKLNGGAVNFSWQSLYHDHVIRDKFALNQIRKYIRENPINWGKKKPHRR